MLRKYATPIIVVGMIAALALPMILEFVSAVDRDKPSKDHFSFYGYLSDCERSIFLDSLDIDVKYDSSNLYLVFEGQELGIGSLEKIMDTLSKYKSLERSGIFLVPFLAKARANEKVANYEFLVTIIEEIRQAFDEDKYNYFLIDFLDYCIENNKDFLLEPINFANSWQYYYNAEYKKAYSINREYFQNWLGYEPFVRQYLRTLWELGKFSELEVVLTKASPGKYVEEYKIKLNKLRVSSSVAVNNEPSRITDNIQLIVLLALFALILAYIIKEIYDYFSIFYSYKDSSEKRKKLFKSMIYTRENDSDIACPICGEWNADIVKGQRSHKEFYVCKEHNEILVPIYSCSNCGTKLDRNMNCLVCGFNQKGELSYVFIFDLLTSFLFTFFVVSQLVLLTYPYTEGYFPFDFAFAKMVNQCLFMLGIFLSLLPFILKDLSITSLSHFYRFDRFFFISINKFFYFIGLMFMVDLLSPVFSYHKTTYFISLVDLLYIPVYIYGLYCFLTFGQEHKGYYEKIIKYNFKGAIYWISFLMLPSLVTNFKYLSFDYDFLSNIENIFFTNKVVFMLIAGAIYVNSRKISKKGNGVIDGIVLYVQENYTFIYRTLFLLLTLTFILILKWFFTRYYVNINLIGIESIILAAYYFIIERQGMEKPSTKKHETFLSYDHNLYLIVYLTFLLILQYTVVLNAVNLHADISVPTGVLNALIFVVKHQVIQILDYKSSENLYFYAVLLSSILLFISVSLIVSKKIFIIFRFTRPKKFVDLKEAARVRLLINHFERLAKNITHLTSENYEGRKKLLEPQLLEQKYLIHTIDGNISKQKLEIVNTLENMINNQDNMPTADTLDSYKHNIKKIRIGYYLPSITEEYQESEIVNSSHASKIQDYSFVLVWEGGLRKKILKNGEDVLQITEKVWFESIELYHRMFSRFYHQITSPYYIEKDLMPYSISISPLKYFAVIFSEYHYFPPSVAKLVAMRWNKKNSKDFIYIYFCDNFPQVNISKYSSMMPDEKILNYLNNVSYKASEDYNNLVNTLDKNFRSFLDDIRGYGYKCEYYPINSTIKITEGFRTIFDTDEKATYSENLVRINHAEYYQAKFVLIVEKANFEQIKALQDEQDDNLLLLS